MPHPTIVWFRDDLRLSDNPALAEACAAGGPVLPIYVHDDASSGGVRALGGAARWWLHYSLSALAADLARRGAPLLVLEGRPGEVVKQVAMAIGASRVVWNRRYGAAETAIDAAAKADLRAHGIAVDSFNGALLHEPWTVRSKSDDSFKVFSPFWRAARALGEPPPPLPAPTRLVPCPIPPGLPAVTVEELGLLPTGPDWSAGLAEAWTPGEAGAMERMQAFLEDGLRLYASSRDRPDLPSTSRLSPHLRFGEISPRQAWHAAGSAVLRGDTGASEKDLEKFRSELGWREFSYHLLFHNPDLATRNFQARFDAFPWRANPDGLRAWEAGRTGFPIVDAGMRQLWRTGWMHNRVRMIVASFLVKDLLVDWRAGEAWFWDTLVDADAANNAASWQWVAGSGADAAPYFRVFNPITQGETFDPDGAYVKTWIPELAGLGPDVVHRPWTASPGRLAAAGIRLGETYPRPIVDHAHARERALAAFAALKTAGEQADLVAL